MCGSAARFGCMGRGPLLSCLLKIHAIVGSTFTASASVLSSPRVLHERQTFDSLASTFFPSVVGWCFVVCGFSLLVFPDC